MMAANGLAGRIASHATERMEWVRPQDIRQACEVFEQYRDKAWSFTDCVSRVVMERLGITTAFAFARYVVDQLG